MEPQIDIQHVIDRLSPMGKLEWDNAVLRCQVEALTGELTKLEQHGNELSE